MWGKPVKIFIPGEFVTLNKYIAANNNSRYEANEIKQVETERARLAGLNWLADPKNKPIDVYPVQVEFFWSRLDEKTDPDNIAFGAKYILDGLVLARVLAGDRWKHIQSISHEFKIDHIIQGVEIWVETVPRKLRMMNNNSGSRSAL